MALHRSLSALRTLSASPVASAPLPNLSRADLDRAILSKARRLHALAVGSFAAALGAAAYSWPSIKTWSYQETKELAEMTVGHPFLQAAAAALGRKVAAEAILSADPYTTARLKELLGDVVDSAREDEPEAPSWTAVLADKMAQSQKLRDGVRELAGDVATRPVVTNAAASLGRNVSRREPVLGSCKEYVTATARNQQEKQACSEYVRHVVYNGWFSEPTYHATREAMSSILADPAFRSSAQHALWLSAKEKLAQMPTPKLAKKTPRQLETL